LDNLMPLLPLLASWFQGDSHSAQSLNSNLRSASCLNSNELSANGIQGNRFGVKLLKGALLALFTFGSICLAQAQAQDSYPSKPIRMIVPLAAGSAVDGAARLLTAKMSQNMGQPIVIENMAGSSGLIGADRIAKAAPDGYTIGGVNDSILTMLPHIYTNIPWNALKDFEPISLVATIEWGIVVAEQSPYKTLNDFIAAAKANPGKINYGSGGSGSPQHIAMALFAQRTGIDLVHVPYKGATPAAIAAAAGQVEVTYQGLGTVTSLIQGGKLRLLAVSTPERLAQYPNVPTIAQAGISDFFFNSWFAMIAPAGTPKPIIDKLNAEMQKALADPQTRERLMALGVTIRGTSAAEFSQATEKQYALYGKLIKDNKIQAD
jgi:tripartite-type tricarboxylate transporter receptor subunit TctC